jgi:hypothetical protein
MFISSGNRIRIRISAFFVDACGFQECSSLRSAFLALSKRFEKSVSMDFYPGWQLHSNLGRDCCVLNAHISEGIDFVNLHSFVCRNAMRILLRWLSLAFNRDIRIWFQSFVSLRDCVLDVRVAFINRHSFFCRKTLRTLLRRVSPVSHSRMRI